MKGKAEWAIVSAPHDVTGPPVNVCELSLKDRAINMESQMKSRSVYRSIGVTC